MGKTISFYNIGIFRNDKLTSIDFIEFIDEISNNEWNKQVRKIDGEILAIYPMYYNEQHKEIRVIPLGKFRQDYKPFTGYIQKPTYDEIKEDVIEMVTLVYNSKYRTIAVDFNTYGAKKKLIEKYFASFLPQNDDERWEVKMEEVIATFDEKELDNSKQIRDIEITLDLSRGSENFMKEHTKIKKHSILNAFTNLKETSDDCQANIIRIELGALKNRDTSIDKAALKLILNTLDISSDVVKSVKIRYKNDKEEYDTIDLKKLETILKIKVLENTKIKNPAPEALGNAIIESFEKLTTILYKSNNKFIEESSKEYAFMPKLVKEPRNINRIEGD